MSGTMRAAILGAIAASAGATAACEALVGITDRQVAEAGASSDGEVSDGTAGGPMETGPESASDSMAAEGAADETGGNEAGPGTGADADAGSSTDGSSSDADAGPAAEGSVTDAGDGGDGAVLDPDLPCSMQGTTLFCDDFDTSSMPGSKWDQAKPIVADSGVVRFDTTDFVSPPQSAQVVAPPIT
ncbi:MAG: hypothetical protein ACRENE_21795, partial [Polyangiaceae bacterium]